MNKEVAKKLGEKLQDQGILSEYDIAVEAIKCAINNKPEAVVAIGSGLINNGEDVTAGEFLTKYDLWDFVK
jgi:hypothetical protein